MEYECKICNRKYRSYQSLWIHNKKFHNKIKIKEDLIEEKEEKEEKINILQCKYCNKIFSYRQSRLDHEKKYCKEKNNIDIEKNTELEIKKINAEKEKLKEEKEKIKEEKLKLKEENKMLKLKNALQNANKLDKKMEKFDEMKSMVSNLKLQIKKIEENKEIELNNRFLNIITEKNNIIEEFNNKFQAYKENKELITINQEITQIKSLTFNGVVIVSRSTDKYINATELCKVGAKKFNDWRRLDTTKQLLVSLESDTGIPVSQLVDIKKGNSGDFNQGSWIHPDLAIQLAQWISPSFALQVSKWIRTLFTDGNVSINIELQNELKISNNKIKLLEDTYLKKHKRKDYLENVIYIVSTEENIKKRIYIIGKAISFKNRLSTYNKTGEHIVIYNKSCKNKDDLTLIESIVLNKLNKYREKANRDRFILPLEKDITLFTDIIDDAINYL